MDEIVLRGAAKWPGVPDVFGWLALDRRGNWLLRSATHNAYERISNLRLREFIGRNYAADPRGRWYFQNGPQRVFVRLAYAPLVLRAEADLLVDHCGVPFDAGGAFLDDEGSLLVAGTRGVGLLDDRDLERYVDALGEAAHRLPRIARHEVPAHFGFVADPGP
ncbi:MAG: DUF2946 family protein [Burkholderiales bacterium]|nr:DUF2946 family protein [Burkholderiales bacterium]